MAVANGVEMIGGCTTSETPKIKTVVYPPLPYNKIQPPQEGCLVGFFIEPEDSLRMKDSRFIPQESKEIEAIRRSKSFDEFRETLQKEGRGKYIKLAMKLRT